MGSVNILQTKRFLPLFITQFLGAFNDNLFKNALVIFITYHAASSAAGSAQILVTLAAGLFILPFLLFSALAGQIADKYDRAKVARRTKILEMVLMLLAAVGFYFQQVEFLLAVLFCMGVQSTFFGPVKFSLLPQHLQDDELLAGNAYIGAATFLAILTGTLVGGVFIAHEQGHIFVSLMAILCAVAGYQSSRYIPVSLPSSPQLQINWDIVRESLRMIQYDRKNPRVFRCIMLISWFWLVGATFLSQFPTYTKEILHGDETLVTLFLTVFSIGIGMGALLCNYLLKGQLSGRYIPYAALGISLFTVDLCIASRALVGGAGEYISAFAFMAQPDSWRIVIDLCGVAISGGVFVVPLYAIMQHDSDPAMRARTIASNNILNALFMVLAAVVTIGMLKASLSVTEVFLWLAGANLLMLYFTVGITKLTTRID